MAAGKSGSAIPLQLEQHKYHLAQQGKSVAETLRQLADQFDQFSKDLQAVSIQAVANGTAAFPVMGLPVPAVNGIASPTDGTSGKKRKREKKLKDPNAPKRPASPYLLYQNDVRGVMKEKFPDLPYKELLGKIAESWTQLDEGRKKKYMEAAHAAKEQYDDNKAKYDEEHGIPPKARKSVAGAAQPAPAVAKDESDEMDSEDEDDAPAPAPAKPSSKAAAVKVPLTESESGTEESEDESSESEKPQPKKKQKAAPASVKGKASKEKKNTRAKA